MRWNEAVTLEFVKIYLKQECLWNPAHSGYKMKYQREKAYEDISNEFRSSTMKSLTVPEVKIKIKNLRTTYVQQVHKILQKSSPDCIYEPSLVWFQEMDQCLKHISSIRHSNSYNQESDLNSNQQWTENDLHNSYSEETKSHILLLPTNEYDLSKVKLERHSPLSERHCKRIKKRKSKHRYKGYSTDSSTESVVMEDEFDIYGKFIASQLRKMTLQKAIQLQLKIQNLISKARITDFNNHQQQNSLMNIM